METKFDFEDENLEKDIKKNASGLFNGIFIFIKSVFRFNNDIDKNATINSIKIERIEDLILIDIKAKGFLYGMVRSIVGQLVLVGETKITPEIFRERWKSKKKHDVRESAPAKGLCFVNSVYEESIFKRINKNDLFPKFIINGSS